MYLGTYAPRPGGRNTLTASGVPAWGGGRVSRRAPGIRDTPRSPDGNSGAWYWLRTSGFGLAPRCTPRTSPLATAAPTALSLERGPYPPPPTGVHPRRTVRGRRGLSGQSSVRPRLLRRGRAPRRFGLVSRRSVTSSPPPLRSPALSPHPSPPPLPSASGVLRTGRGGGRGRSLVPSGFPRPHPLPSPSLRPPFSCRATQDPLSCAPPPLPPGACFRVPSPLFRVALTGGRWAAATAASGSCGGRCGRRVVAAA